MNNLCLTLGHRFAGVEKNGSAASLHASDRHRKASMKPKRPRVDSSAGALLLRRTLWYEFFILCSHVCWHQRSPSRQLGEEKSALSLLGGLWHHVRGHGARVPLITEQSLPPKSPP